MPFTNVYFVNLGLSGREIGQLSALLPLMTLTVAPALAGLVFLPVALCARLLEEGPVIERAARRPLRAVGRDRGLIVLMAAACVVGAALGMDGAFQGVYVTHLGGGGLIVGLLFGVSA